MKRGILTMHAFTPRNPMFERTVKNIHDLRLHSKLATLIANDDPQVERCRLHQSVAAAYGVGGMYAQSQTSGYLHVWHSNLIPLAEAS
jgi:hypothetical protein